MVVRCLKTMSGAGLLSTSCLNTGNIFLQHSLQFDKLVIRQRSASEFYKDVLPEFEQCGMVTQFRVCNNEEPHLRGNVYVEYSSRRNTLKAYRMFQGRFYAGRRLNVEFTNIPSWKNAVCGLYHKKKCPKGKTCNFLHVFENPDNAFKIDGYSSSSRRQFSRSCSQSPRRRRSRSKEWTWSEGSDSDDNDGRRGQSNNSKSKVHSKKYDSNLENGKRKRSRSRSPSRTQHKSKGSNKSRKRSRSRNRDGSRDVYKRNKSRSRKHNEKHRSKSRSPRHAKYKRDSCKDEPNKMDKKEKAYTSRKIIKKINGT